MNLDSDNFGMALRGIPILEDSEADVLNDETFGDCDLEAIKIKSDFGENGEFLGDNPSDSLPAFFDTDVPDIGGISLDDDGDDQSQQPSIDALLGEDPMRFSTSSMNRRPGPFVQQTSINPLFNMAISQAQTQETNRMNLFPQSQQQQPPPPPPPPPPPQQQPQQQVPRRSPMALPQQQMNYQLLKQFEQMLINKQVPPQERLVYIQAMMEKMQREALNAQQQQQQQIQLQQQQLQQQQATRLMNMNINGHDRYHDSNPSRVLNNPMLYAQRQQQQREASMRSMAIGEMLERARLTAGNATNINPARSQSPGLTGNTGMSSQFMDAIQRSDQIPIAENNRPTESPSSSLDNIVSPSSSSRHSRHNRPAKHYPRPPLLNTWQGRGPGHDEFSGLMTDREKQWVVKIQLHQVSQTQEEDYYFHKWSQQKRHMQQVHGNQSNRHEHRGQFISYPVLQLLKSIQQEKELSQRLSQSSIQASFSNVNPAQALPYAPSMPAQLGKQSTATPRHPKCILDLDGQFTLGVRKNAITHDKYTLGLLLNIENIHRDILRLDDGDDDTPATPSKTPSEVNSTDGTSTTITATPSSKVLNTIIGRYLNHPDYLFADMFAQFSKGQILLERLYPYLVTTTSITNHLELMLIRLYGSLNYMIRCWPTTFHIESIVMNMISLMQQQVNIKKTTFEQLLSQVYIYYDQKIKPKLLELNSTVSSSPFSDPVLFTNSHTVTILIELLLTLERRCYLLPGMNSSTLPVQLMQQLQPQLQYQLSEHVRLLVTDLCQALVSCSSPTYTPKKMLKPFAQVQQQQFTLLCKFLRIQIPQQIYPALESKLIFCCIKDT
ncbi:unnamed protein product [Rotaria magnacalcarata]